MRQKGTLASKLLLNLFAIKYGIFLPLSLGATLCECAAVVDDVHVVGDLTIVIEAFFYPQIDMKLIMIFNVVSFNKIHN